MEPFVRRPAAPRQPSRRRLVYPSVLGLVIAVSLGSCVGVPEHHRAGGRETSADKSSRLFVEYATANAPGLDSVLPEYSFAGYHRCERPLPDVTRMSHRYVDVTAFGAKADDGRSDRDGVLLALQAARSHGGPVVVYFPPGRFRLNEAEDVGKPPVVIDRGQLVLKGGGIGKTELFFAEPALLGASLITVTSDRPPDYYWRGGAKIAGVLPGGTDDGFSIEVDDASRLREGMVVNVDADLNVNLGHCQSYFAPHAVPEGPKKRHGGKNDYMFELHRIREIDGRTVTFAEPIHLDLPHLDSVVLWSVDHTVEEAGVEDMTLRGNYHEQFSHHNGSHFGEDYRMLRFEDAFNCWVNRVRIVDYSFAVSVWRSGFNTFANILAEGNAGHSLMTVRNSYGNLFAYVREYTDTHHGLGVAGAAANTVFLRCVQYANMEAHCGWARATLYDVNEGRFSTRGGGATFTPHHGKRLCFWNWNVLQEGSCDFWPEGKRYGYFMPPIIAGLHGAPFDVADRAADVQAWECPGTPVLPESLFEAQLALRLGGMPDWMTEESRAFEEMSRQSRVTISAPCSHSVWSDEGPIPVSFAVPTGLASDAIAECRLLVSDRSLWGPFADIDMTEGGRRKLHFRPSHPGAWALRVRMTNRRGEVTESAPCVVFVGREDALEPVSVAAARLLPQKAKTALYGRFKAKGGGEGKLSNSMALKRRKEAGLASWQIEKEYSAEAQTMYRAFGSEQVSTVLAEPIHASLAAPLVDGDLQTAGTELYGWLASMIQFDFGEAREICRLDIVWKERVPETPVRLELQTASDPAAWTSVVNDESLWEFGVVRVGGTLQRRPLPGETVTSLYFPQRQCRYARLLLTGFPNGVAAEMRFLGRSVSAPQ